MWLRKLAGYFLRGALVSVPIALTLYIILALLSAVDRFLPVGIPGLGLLLTLALITLMGVLASNVVGRTIFETAERTLRRVPLIKLVYNSIKDLIGAFVGDRRSFDRPVTVRPSKESDVRILGFVTRDNLEALGLPGHVAVYLPQSYNFAGLLLLVPSDQVHPLDVSTAEIMTFVVSGGVSGLGIGQSVLPPPSQA